MGPPQKNHHHHHHHHHHHPQQHHGGKWGGGGKGSGVSTWPVHHASNHQYPSFAKGEKVAIFYRFEYDGSGDGPEAYFPVTTVASGQLMPRMGKTDCWQPAVIAADFTPGEFDPYNPLQTGVLIHLLHPLWYNRHGNLLDVSGPKNTEIRVHPADVSRGAHLPVPEFSFVVVRWGGHFKTPDYNELQGEEGGWGSIGTSISDGYIRAVFDRVYQRLGSNYEVLTCYVQSAHDLQRLTAPAVIPQLSGSRCAGCYFLWPISFMDGTCRTPGYVEKEALFNVMREMECSGVETAFPHPSYLYRMLVSKEWCSYVCSFPDLQTPATTRVSRAAIHADSESAAVTCLEALTELTHASGPVIRGVAKLGYSWEASDVLSFQGKSDLARKLETLLSQPGCDSESVIVQEFVESDLEIRVFCLDGLPVKLLYTRFCENTKEGSFTAFKSVPREVAVQQWFGGSDRAMQHAEGELCRLTRLWMRWLRGINSKRPSFLRIDYFVKRQGDVSVVHTGELTEVGASCLGWAEGWTATFDAVIHAGTGMPFPNLLAPLDFPSSDDWERKAKRVHPEQGQSAF